MNEISEKLSLNKFSEIVIDCIKFRHLFEIHNVKGKYSKIPYLSLMRMKQYKEKRLKIQKERGMLDL